MLRVKWGKCAQDTSDGFLVPLMQHKVSLICPVFRLRTLHDILRKPSVHLPLFSWSPASRHYSSTGGFFSVWQARRWLKRALASRGLQDRGYTFHSFRRGACTGAFRGGAAVGDIQMLGGWRSDAVRLYYPALEARTRAAKALVS